MRIIVRCIALLTTFVAAQAAAAEVPRDFDFQQMQRGGALFQQHCAVCHGTNAEGASNWQKTGPDGKYPPPPLNGTAHAWHHPTSVLIDVIRNGTIRIGGNMPPWKDKLDEAQIRDIIAWFQAKWPDEIYAAWYRIEKGQ
ncbi:MAG: cytochrome c [Gammaproteobacteria bacterium]|nr:cytochrome c [Gammaproteobacteria bacterium]MDH5652568.1 cytochrome c [Gammaproteobacteria bacterium]